MTAPVSREDWLAARRALLEREKAHTRARDELAAARRALPRFRIDSDYTFTGPDGPVTLSDLFGSRSQLAIYHFMYGAGWDNACPSCSFWGDNLNGTAIHLAHRDVSLALVSAAPIGTLNAYRERMGWDLTWVSSDGTTFNRDFHVSFTAEEVEGEVDYNFTRTRFPATEAPGLSAFIREGDAIYHTYSTYARGLDHFNGAYQLLDLMPKGRDEDGLAHSMAWLRRHDEYEA